MAKQHVRTFLWLVAVAMLLDMLDGFAARRLGQASRFGVFLDVFVDLSIRSTLYVLAAVLNVAAMSTPLWLPLLACAVVVLEWTTFVCSHGDSLHRNAHWKQLAAPSNNNNNNKHNKHTSNRTQPTSATSAATPAPPPRLIGAVFANGFYSPTGALAIVGLNCLPVCCILYSPLLQVCARRRRTDLSPQLTAPSAVLSCADLLLVVVLPGRALAALAELWFVQRHVRLLATLPHQ